LQDGCDVIVISPPVGNSHDFSLWILKERLLLPDNDPQ